MRRTATIMWRMLSTGEPWRCGRARLEMPEGDAPRQTRVPQDGPAEQLAQSAGPELAGLSTGSSSLLAGEEVAPCPA